MLYYSGILVSAAFIAATLSFLAVAGTAAWLAREIYASFVVLCMTLLAGPKKHQVQNGAGFRGRQ